MLQVLCASGSSHPHHQVADIIPRIFNGVQRLVTVQVPDDANSSTILKKNQKRPNANHHTAMQWIVTGMQATSGETLTFKTPVIPEGNCEHWLEELEFRMRLTVGQHITSSLTARAAMQDKSTKWLASAPGQIIDVCESITLTRQLEDCFQSSVKAPRKLREMDEGMAQKIQTLVHSIRRSNSTLLAPPSKTPSTKSNTAAEIAAAAVARRKKRKKKVKAHQHRVLLRKKMENVILLHLNMKNTLVHLIENKIDAKTSFEMLSQLKFYWRPRTTGGSGTNSGHNRGGGSEPVLKEVEGRNLFEMLEHVKEEKAADAAEAAEAAAAEAAALDPTVNTALAKAAAEQDNHYDPVYIAVMHADVCYENEFIGTVPRLSLTPLVLKCQRTLACAFQIHNGFYVTGTSGVGKTDMCKDIATTVGVPVSTVGFGLCS